MMMFVDLIIHMFAAALFLINWLFDHVFGNEVVSLVVFGCLLITFNCTDWNFIILLVLFAAVALLITCLPPMLMILLWIIARTLKVVVKVAKKIEIGACMWYLIRLLYPAQYLFLYFIERLRQRFG